MFAVTAWSMRAPLPLVLLLLAGHAYGAHAPESGPTTTTTTTVDSGGLQVNATTTEVVTVAEPPSSATQSGFAVSALFGSGEDISLGGFALDAHLRFLSGGPFPGTEGGGWLGLFVEPAVGLNVTQVSTTSPRVCVGTRCSGGTTEESTSGAFTASATAGLQFMHFGPMSADDRLQSGYGFAAGAQVATFVPFEEGDASTSVGPAFSLLSADYNPGTARLETSNLNLLFLPMETMTIVMIGYSSNVD
jgi:hypothetical protein